MPMFNPLRIFLISILIFNALASCSPQIPQYEGLLRGISAEPEILTIHQDSIRFKLEGAIPLQFLKKGTKVTLYPEYVYGEGALRLGELVAFDGTYEYANKEAKVDATYVFPYLQGMDSGRLVLKGFVEQKSGSRSVPEKTLAAGTLTTALLTRIGQITPDEPIPQIGVYMDREFLERTRLETREYLIPFALNKADIAGRELKTSDKENLITLNEPGKTIESITVTGLTSPESSERNNKSLADQRSKAILQRLKSLLPNKNIDTQTNTRINDWFDFRLLLGEYNGITPSQKEAYYNIILNDQPFENQLKELQKLPTYSNVSKALFPKLRAGKISVTSKNTGFSEPTVAAGVFKLLNEGEPLEGITKDHLIYAGELAKRLSEKEAIYSQLIAMDSSDLAFNNLGVVYLNNAQRELDTRERNIYITKAVDMFRQANQRNTTSVSMHNLGRAYLMRKDFFDAYVAISEASTLERNENDEFLRYNEGVRGALDVINGDYKLAIIRLSRAPETETNLFNKGLAYLLADDLKNALISFEESVQKNREFGYGFYGLALIAADTGDKQALYENLAKAVEKSEYLRSRALRDIAFKYYTSDPKFLAIFKEDGA